VFGGALFFFFFFFLLLFLLLLFFTTSSSSSSFTLSSSSSLPLRRDAALLRSRAGERHQTTENKVFLRFPVLSSLAPSLSRHFRVEYTRERRGFISTSARGTRKGARTERSFFSLSLFSLSVSLCLSRKLPIKWSSMRVGLLNG